MAGARTLHVRCATWEQVEVFHTRKLRRGKLLSMRVPFRAEPGAEVTLNLELPNQVVIVVDGVVLKASPVEADPKAAKSDAGKTWLEVELVGFTEDVIARIRRMAAGADPAEEAPSPPRRARTTGQIAAVPGDDHAARGGADHRPGVQVASNRGASWHAPDHRASCDTCDWQLPHATWICGNTVC